MNTVGHSGETSYSSSMSRRADLPLLFVLTLFLCVGSVGYAAAAPTSTQAPAGFSLALGEIEGARFTLALPVHWNGRLLLLAHGIREEQAPLIADLNPNHLAYRTLLDEGWIIGKTSYRRNGLIVRDAIADLENLRAHVAKTYGVPQMVILEGDSMGGAIVTLIAEQFAEQYQGAVAVDAALQVRDPDNTLAFNLQPQIPLVFLTNEGEFEGPRHYLTAPFPRSVRPVVLRVARVGHVNVNQRERLVALRTLLNLIDRRPIALPRVEGTPSFLEATQQPEPGPSQVQLLDDGGFEARVTEVTAIFGNLGLNAQPSDFEQIGIVPGAWFELSAKGKTYRTRYGRDFNSAKRGGWVAFPNADGFFYLGRNRDNAATTTGLQAGDVVAVRRLSAESATSPPASPP
jgi:pimeloyl-ACP methyl ester carboxylesterase